MRLFKTMMSAVLALAVGSTMLAAQGTGERMAHPKDGDKKQTMQKRPDSETPEMKMKRHKATEFRVEMINLMVKYGKIEKARGDFIIREIANEKAFKDANPEWVKYGRGPMMGRQGAMHPGMKCCPMMGGKDRPGMKNKQGKDMKGRPGMKHDMRPGSAPDFGDVEASEGE